MLYNYQNFESIENFYRIFCRSSPQRHKISTVWFRDRLYRVYDVRRINFKHGRKFERPTNQPTNQPTN